MSNNSRVGSRRSVNNVGHSINKTSGRCENKCKNKKCHLH